ncbi:GntR family transcriptional regulator [Neobacillus pocheonensis]|uniref:GntR family transcriptional regulator n=1 Tax=Neobacillus pocheonensis TaxID=363869 RepID=UPI003D2A4E6D
MIYDLINNEFEPMQKIPSEQKLSEQLGVSRNTVREAIRTLEQEGILLSRHGVGNFVIGSKKSLKTTITTLESSTNIINAHGYIPGTKNVVSKVIEVPEDVKCQLMLDDNKNVFYIERVRTADGEAVVYVEDYIPYKGGMELEYKDTYHESLLEYLEKFDYKVSFSICTLKAVISDEKTEKKLDLIEKSALLLLKQIHYSTAGVPVLYSDSYYLSDKFEFNVVRKRV